MKKLPKLNTSEKALVELNGSIIPAIRSYRNRTDASLEDAKNEVYRFQENPEAYEAEESDQEQRRRDLERCVKDIRLEVDIFAHMSADFMSGQEDKNRHNIIAHQNRCGILSEHIENILAPVFGVDLDGDENE